AYDCCLFSSSRRHTRSTRDWSSDVCSSDLLNGKLDLLQAEATADLIDAGSPAQRRRALQQLDRGLSGRLAALRAELLELEALIAYDIDFPEEDEGPVSPARVTAAWRAVGARIAGRLATAPD